MSLIKKAFAVPLGELRGPGRIGLQEGQGPEAALTVFVDVLSAVVGILTVAAAIWFLFNFIIAAYQFMSAGGDNQKIKEAQQKIQNSIVGLFLVVAAIFLLSLFGTLIGIDFLNIGELINQVGI